MGSDTGMLAPSIEAPGIHEQGEQTRDERNRRESIGLAFFWLVILAYGFFVPSILSWNTESHLYPAFALVDRHTIRIDAYQQGLGDKSYYRGHYYTDKAPGLSFLAVPIYAAERLAFPTGKVTGFKLYKHIANYYYIPERVAYLRYGITYILVAIPSAALAILLWLFLLRLTGNLGWSLALAAIYALGTIAYVYSIWFFSHQICAVLLFSAFLLLFYRLRGHPPDRRALLATGGAGLLTGYSIISEYPTVVIGALIGLYLLAVTGPAWQGRVRAAAAFVAGMLPPAALEIGYNLSAYGKPLATGYNYVHSAAYHVHIHGGFLGLGSPSSYGIQPPTLTSIWEITLGSYRGIFLLNPVLLLFIPGVYFMWRRRDLRPEFWLCLAVVLLYFLLDASRPPDTNGWSGGSSVASRHLTPMVPFMIVPVIFGIGNHTFRIALAVLGAMSVVIMFMSVSSTYLFPYTDHNPLVNEVLPNFFSGQIEPNWGYLLGKGIGLVGFASLLPLFAIAAVLVGRLLWLLRTRPPVAVTHGVAELEAH